MSSGCSQNRYIGVWFHDGVNETASFRFENKDICDFTFVSKGAIDGMSFECKYQTEGNMITVSFQPNSEEDIMVLEYQKDENILVETEPKTFDIQFKFEKLKNEL
jgi:hypothetical protein